MKNFEIYIEHTKKCLICGHSVSFLKPGYFINLPTENSYVSISFDLNNHHYQLYISDEAHIETLKYKLYHCLKGNIKDIKLTDITQISIKYSKNEELDNLMRCEQLVDKQNVFVTFSDKFITNLKINKMNKNININASLLSLGVNTTVTLGDNYSLTCKCPGRNSKAKEFTGEIIGNPSILILGIDRTIYDEKTKHDIKDNHLLLYPENLNFNGVNYNLFGVVNHSGTLEQGHYWACVKTRDNNKWYNANDSSVTQINIDDVINKNTAMILFYIRSSIQ